MSKRIYTFLQYFIFIGLGAFLIWWQLYSMTDEQTKEFKNALYQANYLLIIPVVIISILSHLSRAARWKILMQPLGYVPKLTNVFAVTMVGYLANSFVPRVGEVIKCSLLAKYEGLKTDKLIGTIIIERTFDLISYGIFLLITVLIQVTTVGAYVSNKLTTISQQNNTRFWLKLIVVISLIVAIIYLIKWLIKKYPNSYLLTKIKGFTNGVLQGLATIKKLERKAAFIGHTLFIWTMYLLQIYIGFKAMEATAHLGITAACAVLSLSTLAMIATPGGMGSFPLFVMETLVIYGVVPAEGFAFGWLIWGVSTLNIILVGFISLLILLNTKITVHENNTSDTEQDIPAK